MGRGDCCKTTGVDSGEKKFFFRPFSLLFGLEIRESAARAPSLDPQLCGHVTSRHGHALSIQFGDNQVVWSEANYYCS